MKTSGEKFFDVRDALGLTQMEFADFLGISAVTLRNYEGGEPRINEQQRLKLSQIGVNPAYILCDEPCNMLLKGKMINEVRDLARKAVSQ